MLPLPLMVGTADLVVEQQVFIVLLEQQQEQPLPQVKVTMAVLLTQQQTKKLEEEAAVLTPQVQTHQEQNKVVMEVKEKFVIFYRMETQGLALGALM